jgi:hypothetical protein
VHNHPKFGISYENRRVISLFFQFENKAHFSISSSTPYNGVHSSTTNPGERDAAPGTRGMENARSDTQAPALGMSNFLSTQMAVPSFSGLSDSHKQ